jgi:hypothetical protein
MSFAGITADSIQRESMGSTTLIIANFSSVTSSTYIPAIPNAVSYWAAGESTGISVSTSMASAGVSGASSGVYFYLMSNGAGGAQDGRLFIMSRI